MDVKQLHLPTARVVHDVPSDTPFWGIPTATIDWCEESKSSPSSSPPAGPSPPSSVCCGHHGRWTDSLCVDYKVTPYIAEFVNTVTNAFFSSHPLPRLSVLNF
jgi:hypothetical protein